MKCRSAEWIQHEFDQGDKPLSEYGLTAEQVEIICDICRAHSSVEDRKETTGLFAPELSYKKDGHTGKIRVKALAGIVRIADELDVARNRLKRADEMDRLLTAADDDRAEVQMFIRENENSRKHFRRLLLIRSLERCEENTTQIALKLDMGQVEKRRMAGAAEKLVDDLDDFLGQTLQQFHICTDALSGRHFTYRPLRRIQRLWRLFLYRVDVYRGIRRLRRAQALDVSLPTVPGTGLIRSG